MNLNLPNKLTLTRIILVPIVFLLMLELPWSWASGYNAFVNSVTGRVLVLILFCAASLTDFFDGKIARKYNLVTNFGKFMDPLADKLLVLAVFLAFVPSGRLHAVLYFIILARELIITGLRQIAMEQGVVIAASMWGKWKTTFQMFAIIALMIEGIVIQTRMPSETFDPASAPSWLPFTIVANILVGIAVVLTLVSAVDYIHKNKQLLHD